MTEPNGNQPSAEDLTPSLVTYLRQGNAAAGALLDQIYRSQLIRFCYGYLGSTEEAEDVVQDVFFRVLKSDAVPDNFRAWIYKICRNRCIDVLRARSRKRDDAELPTGSFLDAELTGHLTRLVKRELRSQLRHLVATLPPNQREVLRLRYSEGLSRLEIAEVLDLPESVVKSRLYEGIVKLRDHPSLQG